MVGRELQKIHPYGEDHQGLVRGKEEVVQAGMHSEGRRIDESKNWKAMKMMGKALV